nr:MAG TPA: hypothetical protein [Caudoviricetes sp.]
MRFYSAGLLLPSIIGGLPFLRWYCCLLQEARPRSRQSSPLLS